MPGGQGFGRAMWSLAAVNFLVRTGFGLVLPGLPLYVRAYGMSIPDIGLGSAAYMAVAVLGMLLVAPLSDRFGHRRFLFLGALAYVLSAATLLAVPDLVGLLVGRALSGLAMAVSVPASNAYVAVAVPPEERGGAYGLVSSASMAGFALGPPLGGLALAGFGVLGPLVLAVAVGALSVVAVLLVPQQAPALAPLAVGGVTAPPRAAGRSTARAAGLGGMAVLLGLFLRAPWAPGFTAMMTGQNVAGGVYDTTWSLYLFHLGAPSWLVGASFTVWALPLVLLSPLVGRRVAPARSVAWLIAGNASVTVCAALYPLMPNAWLVALLGVGEGIGAAVAMPLTQLYLSLRVPAERMATIQGAVGALGQGAALVAAAASGYLFVLGPGIPFYLVALVTGAGTLWFVWASRAEARRGQTLASWLPDEERNAFGVSARE